MFKTLTFFLLFTLHSFSQPAIEIKSNYPNYIGDIEFNSETDDKDFELSAVKHTYQYFNNSGGLEYEGEKVAIEKEFAATFKSDYNKNETGLIRINFVVNYKGKTDRFRLLAMDENYNPKVFSPTITNQLLSITKNLKGWKVKKYNNLEIDYYQYLIFKIENGQLNEILP